MDDNRENLLELFFRTEHLLHRLEVVHFREHGPMGSPHRGQGRVLSILKIQPEISQKQLAYLLYMRNQSLGELLSKLEKAGLITRTPSEEDKRAMIIRLTEAGVDASQDIDEGKSFGDKAFDALNEEECNNLRTMLAKIIESLDEQFECADEKTPFFPPFHGHGHHGPGHGPFFGMNPFVAPFVPWHMHHGSRHGSKPAGVGDDDKGSDKESK